MGKKDYKKLGGWLLVFVIFIVLWIIPFFIAALAGLVALALALVPDMLFLIYSLQMGILIAFAFAAISFIPIKMLYIVLTKQYNGHIKIKRLLIGFAVIQSSPILLVLFVVIFLSLTFYRGSGSSTGSIFLCGVICLLLLLVEAAICIAYFNKSKRVAVYFNKDDNNSSAEIDTISNDIDEQI